MAASANLLADTVGAGHALYAPARYLAHIAAWGAAAILYGITTDAIGEEQQDEAHAWSELNCHRAAEIRALANSIAQEQALARDTWRSRLLTWAEEDRLFSTRLIGGEYSGAWIVDGVQGIRRKP